MRDSRPAACPEARLTEELLSRRERDTLRAEEERGLRHHLTACRACSEAALRRDPTLLFLPLAAPAPEASPDEAPDEVSQLVSGVLGAIESHRRRWRVSAGSLLKAAAVLVAAGLLFLLRPRPAPSPALPVPVAGVPSAPVLAAGGEPAPPLIEGVGNPRARVYQFAASSPGEPNVVFVANPAADL